ncbi:DNA-binding transcriptional LysR family regulator [Cytobacillus horneckiae]|uniref:LysR family transcriptional regulator n=2 Tax=Cytobacillus horneckiae TaxID=549687 RepID=UPI0019D209D3|nr:LysR family transcriptional regulator [Cytobacillus horneckiae]MBN6888331.1 LysR family transcriptional regulator [Cytobacillus horneckiae]MCM3180055.1 LysR family transcriptional regulator [Cytobacillus horneckiae]
MELLQLRYFQKVAQMGNMTKAANELMVSQPALSKMISRLEENLGAPLFHREGRSIRLNDFGQVYLERVNRIFLEIEEGERQLQDMIAAKSRVTSVSIALPHILPFFIVEFMKRNPDVHIKQHSGSASMMKKQLESGQVDFCISMSPIIGEDIEWMTLLNEEIFLSVPPEHHLAGRTSIELHEAADEIYINRPTGYEFRDLTDEFCKQAGFVANTPIELEEAGAILRLIELGLGISFTPQLSLLQQALPRTVQIPITSPVCRRTIGLAWNKRRYFSEASTEFRNFTINFFKYIALSYYDDKKNRD